MKQEYKKDVNIITIILNSKLIELKSLFYTERRCIMMRIYVLQEITQYASTAKQFTKFKNIKIKPFAHLQLFYQRQLIIRSTTLH